MADVMPSTPLAASNTVAARAADSPKDRRVRSATSDNVRQNAPMNGSRTTIGVVPPLSQVIAPAIQNCKGGWSK